MKRKLLVLDLILAAATVWAGVQLKQQYDAARARELAVFQQKLKPLPPPPYTPLPQAAPVTAIAFEDIAKKMLFDKDRNPNIVPEPVPPPKPKPQPPFPILYGMMNFGDGITAVFSEKDNSPHKDLRVGETIGAYKLVDINAREVVLEWDGKTFTKPVSELEKRKVSDNAPAAAPTAPAPVTVVNSGPAPGVSIGAGIKACTPGDNSPPGTVVDGMRKVVTETPFGPACRWEQVK